MARTARVLVAAALVTALSVSNGRGQAPAPQPAPARPDTPVAGPSGPPPQTLATLGPVVGSAEPGTHAAAPLPPERPYLDDHNGDLLQGDPLLDGPPCAPPGWFAALEVDPAGPHVKNRLAEPVSGTSRTDLVHLPTADLGWTVVPRLEVGYRLAQGAGEFLLSYRFLADSGSGTVAPFGPAPGPGDLRSRLDLNVVDVDYASREFSLGPGWDMKWLVGLRVAALYFDSTATSAALSQRTTDHFDGVGPHVGLELWRCLGDSGLSLFGRLDSALLVGTVRQSFSETFGAAFGQTDQSATQAVPVLAVQAGLGWQPPGLRCLRLAAGYFGEDWWDVGRVADSRGEVWVQGLFLRAEWRY
jgi:hypothetical protein